MLFFQQSPTWIEIDKHNANDDANTERVEENYCIGRSSLWLWTFLCERLSDILAN